jgi:hypothetical protein
MSATDSLEQLGAEIVARIEAGDKAKEKASNHYLAAGIRLKEAREKTGATFPDFLQKFCPNLRKSRAYQLIAVAGGRTTVEAERTKTAERMRKHRAAKAAAPKAAPTEAAPTEAAPTDRPSRDGQADAKTEQVKKDSPERLLGEVSYFLSTWFPKMDAATLAKAKAMIAEWEPARVQAAA